MISVLTAAKKAKENVLIAVLILKVITVLTATKKAKENVTTKS